MLSVNYFKSFLNLTKYQKVQNIEWNDHIVFYIVLNLIFDKYAWCLFMTLQLL